MFAHERTRSQALCSSKTANLRNNEYATMKKTFRKIDYIGLFITSLCGNKTQTVLCNAATDSIYLLSTSVMPHARPTFYTANKIVL